MSNVIKVEELLPDHWERLRNIRLAALHNDGHAFGGNLESESQMTEAEWRSKFEIFTGLVAVVEGVDVGFMSVENLNGDFGTTCWVGSCWVNSDYRRMGVLRALFAYVDAVSEERDWGIQGLGVWIDNDGAINAYEKLGFSQIGEPQESTRKPGMFYQRMIRTVAK